MNDQDLRDCFAMFAMQTIYGKEYDGVEFLYADVARSAYNLADAMVKARTPEIEEGIVSIKKRVRKS
jgi:hypothetical protein